MVLVRKFIEITSKFRKFGVLRILFVRLPEKIRPKYITPKVIIRMMKKLRNSGDSKQKRRLFMIEMEKKRRMLRNDIWDIGGGGSFSSETRFRISVVRSNIFSSESLLSSFLSSWICVNDNSGFEPGISQLERIIFILSYWVRKKWGEKKI